MVKASGLVAIAMTSEKLMTAAPFVVAPASDVDYLIVEADLRADGRRKFEKACGNVIVATP
jgi:DeoR/GlpR family transcriptional regulator of sugar metabolism